ncbi:MAG: DUF3368 domain-containing protein [Armatimonadetes bacterium]|nr:DUF3368 domain-containing protein [Armatimonadota bacterium]
MADVAVVNASPLIVLAKAGRLELLCDAADSIVVPQAVLGEVAAHNDHAHRAIAATPWLAAAGPVVVPAAVLAWDLDTGESAVIAWVLTRARSSVVIDDRMGRRCAAALGLPVIGSLGLVLLAKRLGRIPAARPMVEELRRAGMYLSDRVVNQTLSLVGE